MDDPRCHCPPNTAEITETEQNMASHLGLDIQYVHSMMDEWLEAFHRVHKHKSGE